MAKPNYAQIHSCPMPLTIYALPSLHPSNPISLLQFITSYVYQVCWLPAQSSHRGNLVQGILSLDGDSVRVYDRKSIRLLWEKGFYGKGCLSRSEPTWLDRERKRLGQGGQKRSEEIRQLRREERKAKKWERARKERELIEEKLKAEGKLVVADDGDAPSITSENASLRINDLSAATMDVQSLSLHDKEVETNEITGSIVTSVDIEDSPKVRAEVDIVDLEYLQLSPEEALFLSYGLGVLDVRQQDNSKPTHNELVSHFRHASYFPPSPTRRLSPDDHFLLSYVVYHHYRSLGWVPRSGVKFAVDWLLYVRGPAFAHAEFAVIILPVYRDAYWWEPARREETRAKQHHDWWWYHSLQRVQAQVKKSVVICWVEVPAPAQEATDLAALLRQYPVRDMCLRRWVPNRNRS